MTTWDLYHRHDWLSSEASIDEALEVAGELLDPAIAEDIVVWYAGRAVAVVKASGRVVRLNVPDSTGTSTPSEEYART